MKTLTLSTGSFDQDNTFSVEYSFKRFGEQRTRILTGCLHQGFKKEDDGIYWVLQSSAAVKSSYTDKDCEESSRLQSMEPLRHDEIVMIDGEQYRFHLNGDYSDMGFFKPV